MISISKYLNGGAGGLKAQAAFAEALFTFACEVLDSIDREVLAGAGSEALRRQFAELKAALEADARPEQIVEAGRTISAMLAQRRAAAEQAALAQAVELQHIFGLLNGALGVLAEGRDRSVFRLEEIQAALQKAAGTREIGMLKGALGETIRFVGEASKQAKEAVSEELGRFETEVSKAREFIGNTRTEVAGRPEGTARIRQASASALPGQAVYAVAYLFDRLYTVVQRYGAEVADELIFRAIKERIQPLAPGCGVYRWTQSSLVGVFARERDLEKVQAEVGRLNSAPLMHRVALGNRTAVLTAAPSHLTAECDAGSAAVLIEHLDTFTGARS